MEATHQDLTSEEFLFFGRPAVAFKRVSGESNGFAEENFALEKDHKTPLQRFSPASFLGEDYGMMVIPGIPAFDFVSTGNSKKLKENFPDLSTPLLKSKMLGMVDNLPENTDTTLFGLQSGKRSALIRTKDSSGKYRWLRLKGCGNNDIAFPLDKVPDKTTLEVRGAMFEHTCFRELNITFQIDQALKKEGLYGANTPIGYFAYDPLPFDEKPKIQRFCGVFETCGDKRLSQHVLLGLETLLPFFFDEKIFKENSLPLIKGMFPKERDNGEGGIQETWLVAIINPEPDQVLIDISSTELPGFVLPTSIPTFMTSFPDVTNLWTKNMKILQEIFKKFPSFNIFASLYWRLGREIGNIQRIIHKNDFNWGTYEDLLGVHCNSHPNNLLLLPPSHPAYPTQLLAPLDFDMAFHHSTFCREGENSEKNEELWKEYTIMENNGMLVALAGDSSINTGVNAKAALSEEMLYLKWALRDTMLKGYISGLSQKEDVHIMSSEKMEGFGALLQLALLATSSTIA
jgi:hypothetical protein